MLRFCDTNVYYSFELSNDICNEIWTTEYPACVDQSNGEAIYEGVECHLITNDELYGTDFFEDKQAVALDQRSMVDFVVSWFSACAQHKLISNDIDIAEWCTSYSNCYEKYYEDINTFDGALSYYEALAMYENHEFRNAWVRDEKKLRFNFGANQVIPELSWMVYEYKKYRKTIWENYLNEIIKSNILNVKYKINLLSSQGTLYINPLVPLDDDLTIDKIDLDDKDSLLYFCNPFKPEFDTNYLFIKDTLERNRADL